MITLSGYLYNVSFAQDSLSLVVTTETVEALSYNEAKPLEKRIDSINVYDLAKSAHKLRFSYMLSNELLQKYSGTKGLNQLLPYILKAAKIVELEPEIIAAVIRTESSFNSQAISNKGASGLMQLMPDTAKELQVKDPLDPEENIIAGSRYLKRQINKFKDIDLALAAYNAGPGNVMKYASIPPFEETQNFVKRVKRHYQNYKQGGLKSR